MALASNTPISATESNSQRSASLTPHRKTAVTKSKSAKPTANLQVEIAKALTKQSKKFLVDWIMEIAGDNPNLLRRLTQEFSIEISTNDLVADTRKAIADATDFDERETNYNFDFDYQAYVTTAKNFEKLLKADRWDELLPLTLELMDKGSYQMQMSDEGMMLDDIDDCFASVIESMYDSHLSVSVRSQWCEAMLKADRTQCISTGPLKSLLDSLRILANES